MLTKVMAFVALSGALWVAGDSLHREFGCCGKTRQPMLSAECCSDCCSISRSTCCLQSAQPSCCDTVYTYCTRTEQVYLGSCCEMVDGKFRCLATGELLDECCCIPIPD